ncbi:MAG TPA: PQQ-binding-like beta-propeller repeat protein [Candidatus Binataceae bacterium]|nr:PQQ-binding-like beta-propeller repeat protein [Candidatus Binataceae bacterium]
MKAQRRRRLLIAIGIAEVIGIWLCGAYYYENFYRTIYLPELQKNQPLPKPNVKWSFKTEWPVVGVSVGSDGIIHAANYYKIYAIDAKGNGKEIPSLSFAEGTQNIEYGNDGTIYFFRPPDTIYASDAQGNQKWNFNSGRTITSMAVGDKGTVYAGSGGLERPGVYAIGPDGRSKWTSVIDSGVYSLAAGINGTIYAGSYDGIVYALDSQGNRMWSFKTGVSHLPDAIGAIAFRAYRAVKGISFNFSFDPGRLVYSIKVGSDGTVYAGGGDGAVYAIDPNGNLKWIFETRDSSVFRKLSTGVSLLSHLAFATRFPEEYTTDKLIRFIAVGNDNTVYAASESMDFSGCGGSSGQPWNGRVYAIDASGSRKWAVDTESFITSVAVSASGTVYFTAYAGVLNDGYVYALAADGNPKWDFESGDKFTPFAADNDGTVYVGYGLSVAALTPP